MSKEKKDIKDKAKESQKKVGGFIGEFKEFALKGNVMDLAVGVIIGAAFKDIVTSLTDNFINPLIALCTGGDGVKVGGVFKINGVVFNYGAFVTAIINFIIMAFILFLMIKGMNKLMNVGKKQEEAAPTTKKCPYCMSEIPIEAVKCGHCTSELTKQDVIDSLKK